MLYLTCTTISSVDLAQYGVSLAKDWVSVECGTTKFGIHVFHNKIRTLIFIFKALYITRLPFVLSFLRIFYWFVTSHLASFCNEVLAVIAQFLEQVPMKSIEPDDLLSK